MAVSSSPESYSAWCTEIRFVDVVVHTQLDAVDAQVARDKPNRALQH